MKLYENCIRCGRKLKNDESKQLGFGKVCYEKWQTETNLKPLFDLGSSNAIKQFKHDLQTTGGVEQ